MKKLILIKRPVALFMLLLLIFHMLVPGIAYGLTTGPGQPEMKGFEPAAVNDLVDPFTGDLTYNIPLMDVGGYPVNIAYHSGSGMDDEASWVGFGWSLSPGVIDRQMRGLPDDFRGDGKDGDKISKEFNLRSDVTGGIDFSFGPEVLGFNIGKLASAGVNAGIFYNNKRGLGIQFGLNANAPLLSNNKSTAGTNTAALSASANLSFNSQNGASFNPSINYAVSAKNAAEREKNTTSLALGASINSRAGLQYISLGSSFNTSKQTADSRRAFSNSLNMSSVSYAAQSFLPETQSDYFNQSYSVAPQFGPEAWGFFAGLQLTGHYAVQKVANRFSTYNAYGYMHSQEGKNDNHALLDFNREKDVPYFDGVPSLPVPVAMPDLFTAHAQDGSAQYRAFPGGSGIFFDHDAVNTGVSASLGVEVGAGAGFKIGGDVQASVSKTSTGKWKTGDKFIYADDNNYDDYGNFVQEAEQTRPDYEPFYFKRVGETVPADGSIYEQVKNDIPVRVKTTGSLSGAAATNALSGKDNTEAFLSKKIMRSNREARNNIFSFLSSKQVKITGLDKQITDYYVAAGGFKPCSGNNNINATAVQPFRKDHHIGEITITDETGARKIYGIPAYNTYQEDVSFSVNGNTDVSDKSKGLVNYTAADASVDNKSGIDHFFSKEMIPAYAHSFLLTGVVSADYHDINGDGITDDDAGTAVKFNYWRKTSQFQWRTPYATGKANYNEGLQSDKTDDRGNYSYGRKELWYLHSIESKTMVAVFETGNRQDAMGADASGHPDTNMANRQQYLKAIRLYSKADWNKNPASALPLKIVHFVYDYSLFASENNVLSGVPNNSCIAETGDPSITNNQGGKLTLKKIYFTYQGNTKGVLHPYEFQYNFNKPYEWKQYDRWANYKNTEDDNPSGVNNDYYAYSCQDKAKADDNAALWQLTSILTPAGGIITIKYEADDYCYVQNRKAMQMYPMAGLGDAINSSSNYYKGDKIYVKLPETLSSDAQLRATYFDGTANDYNKNLFFKALVRLSNKKDKYDYVSGYAEIENIDTDVKLADGYNDIAEIKVKKIKGEGVTTTYHPVAKAAWQFMRLNTPGLVYPGYNVREDLAPLQFVKALVGAITSVTELLAPFDTRAEIKKLAPEVDLGKSWVRLDVATNKTKNANGKKYIAKLGGGSRVREISMSDEWQQLTQSSATTAVYGMVYDYTTTIRLADGQDVLASSGVASYEPMIGNEENPFHQPNKYQQSVKLGPDNAFFIDEPLCESYFPAASVGYSQVKVSNKGADGHAGATGYTSYLFYTEKDFPTEVDHTPIDSKRFGGASILQILKIKSNNNRVVSQGFTISLNDMHGKPKSEIVVDNAGYELSSVYYHYKSVSDDAPEKELNNDALVLQRDGAASNAVIGRDIEMYTDMRSQTSFTAGVNVMMNIDAIYLLFAVVPIPAVLPLPNATYTGFRSASTIKVIQHYGLLDKIVKRQNGSQITTENLAWDAVTGEVLLTRTQNEFDDPVYNMNFPCHWMYEKGMGPAYANLGLVIKGFTASDSGITNSSAYLVSGDELLITDKAGNERKYWVNNAGTTVAPRLVLIDSLGEPAAITGDAVVIRSGRRNMQSMSAGSLLSLINPLKNGRLDISVFTKILDASASIYNDEWAIDAKNIVRTVLQCPPGYLTDAAGVCYKNVDTVVSPTYITNTTIVRQKSNVYGTCGTYLSSQPGAWLSLNNSAEPPVSPTVAKLSTINIWQNGVSACNTGAGSSGDYDGPLNRSGIWIVEKKNNNYTQNEWIGIKTKIYISSAEVANRSADGKTGTLYLGFGGYNNIEVSVDNLLVAARGINNSNTTSPYRTWHIKPITINLDPLNPLEQKLHEIFIRVRSQGTISQGVLGAEIYNNNYSQLATATCLEESCLPCNPCPTCRSFAAAQQSVAQAACTYAKIIWSTKCLVNKRFTYHANLAGRLFTDFDPICTGGNLFEDDNCNLLCRTTKRIYAAKVPVSYCAAPFGEVINPYTTGVRGNWRLQQSFVYHTDRANVLPYIKPGDPDVLEKTDIRKSGAYASFTNFWKLGIGGWQPQPETDSNWVRANELTILDRKGQEIENKDALNRFSAAQFGFQQSAVTAIATNARYTDIAYDSFEDYVYSDGSVVNADSCNANGHFSIRRLIDRFPASIHTDTNWAHTGRNALCVSNTVTDASTISPLDNLSAGPLFNFKGNRMILAENGILKAFAPKAGQQYLLSCWIKEDGANVQLGPGIETGKAAIDIITGGQTFSTIKAGPKLEGWRKVEILFTIPVTATYIKIRYRPGANIAWFDDIRIHPFDAQLKTYAYDNRSMRLWAELDENNFANFYEYDDEGILVRTKKETEKGIMTVKETRSTYRVKK